MWGQEKHTKNPWWFDHIAASPITKQFKNLRTFQMITWHFWGLAEINAHTSVNCIEVRNYTDKYFNFFRPVYIKTHLKNLHSIRRYHTSVVSLIFWRSCHHQQPNNNSHRVYHNRHGLATVSRRWLYTWERGGINIKWNCDMQLSAILYNYSSTKSNWIKHDGKGVHHSIHKATCYHEFLMISTRHGTCKVKT